MPKELAIKNRPLSNPRFTGDMAVEVSFQRQDSDSRQAVRVLPATGFAILRGDRGSSETCPKTSMVVVFILASWLVIVRRRPLSTDLRSATGYKWIPDPRFRVFRRKLNI